MKKENIDEIYLNVGAGDRKLSGFINIDIGASADLQIDVTKGLPWPDDSVSGIYSEHFIEHLSQADGLQFLRECFRILRPGGIVRIATPDCDSMVDHYINDSIHPDWIRFGFEWINNRCERLNIGMRWWGHQWVYNEEELKRFAKIAGLRVVGRFTFGQSPHTIFRDIEHRQGSELIMEFKKEKFILYRDPLVSVAIPAYNPKYFETALLSAISQSYNNIEIIVCNDDRSGKIRDIVALYPNDRIRYYYNEERLGSHDNYLRCFELAKGEYVKYLNDDDILHQDCVEKLLNCFLNYPNLILATSHRQPISANGNENDDLIATIKPVDKSSIIHGISLAKALLETSLNFVGEQTTVMFRKSDLQDIKPDFFHFVGTLMYGAGDVCMWLNLLIKGDAAYLTETLSYFRQHPEQEQKTMLQDPTFLGKVNKARKQARFDWNRLGFDKAFDKSGFLLTKPYPLKDTDCQWNECNFIDRYIVKPESQSLTVSSWRDRHRWSASAVARLAGQVASSVKTVTGVHLLMVAAADENNALADTIDTLAAQGSSGWRLTVFSPDPCPNSLFETEPTLAWVQITAAEELPPALNQAVALSPVDWFMVCSPGIRFEPAFVSLVLATSAQHPDWRCVYFDEERINSDGQVTDPRLKPDANIELLRSSAYIGHAVLTHRALWPTLNLYLAAMPRAFAFDAALRAIEPGCEAALGHIDELAVALPETADGTLEEWALIAKPLLEGHLQRSGLIANVNDGYLPATFFVDYALTANPLISIIIPTKDRLDLLQPCIASLLEKTRYSTYEVIIVDNNSTDPTTLDYLNHLPAYDERIKVLRYAQNYNYSAINNFAARQAKGEFLVLLNNDTVILQENWLERMVALGLRQEVGAVGCRLVYVDQRVQHAGVILGLSGIAEHIGIGSPINDLGYMGRTQLTQNFSAVTAACMLVRKDLFIEVGGLDEKDFSILYNDIDLCLKITERNYRIVWTPFVTLIHHGNSSLKQEHDANREKQNLHSRKAFIKKWGSRLGHDPAYNRHLSLRQREWMIDGDFDTPWHPDLEPLPRIVAQAPDEMGVGQYRVIGPIKELTQHEQICSFMLPPLNSDKRFLPSVAELARAKPTVLFLQNAFSDFHFNDLQLYAECLPDIFRVFGQDDIVFAVPQKSAARKHFGKDTKAKVRRAVSLCHRVITTTEPIAEALRGMCNDIRVMPNYLERSRWGDLQRPKKERRKPRVGWAGAQQHGGDLELMLPVVEATANEVDWIFMGMCPPKLRYHVAEVHNAVPFDHYPATLASLDLDLAIAPLELNQFNTAKSNLRLLEYGAVGYPVIATDILPYQNAPVTRVPNNPKAWIDAIREHVHELDATHAAGEQLREWVLSQWMLDQHLDEWLRALLPG